MVLFVCRKLIKHWQFYVSVITENISDDKSPTKALQLGFELALKERDAVLRENAKAIEERDEAIRELQDIKNQKVAVQASLENITGRAAKLNNT